MNLIIMLLLCIAIHIRDANLHIQSVKADACEECPYSH